MPMQTFEGNEYRRTVLRAALDSGELPDVFVRYGLDYDDSDEKLIGARLDQVLAFWNKDQTVSGKYRDVYGQLTQAHTASRLTLLDERQRQRTADKLQAGAKAAVAAALTRLDQAIATVVQ